MMSLLLLINLGQHQVHHVAKQIIAYLKLNSQ